MEAQKLPEIIQGGMGIGVSSVRLARTVSKQGYLGVVSSVALATTLSRRLQLIKGRKTYEDALRAFPFPEIANKILETYQPETTLTRIKNRFKVTELPSLNPSIELTHLIVAATFVEVYLAKKGHDGLIGINLLEKIQFPTLPTLYGAMLAGVDYVIMGAGIPKYIPNVLNQFSENNEASMYIKVKIGDDAKVSFDPKEIFKNYELPKLKRPKFLAIISSNTLALHLTRNEETKPDGFIVEKPIAGGHNAPPRGDLLLDQDGEPIYGEKDHVNLEKLKRVGLPFWLAGGYGNHDAFLGAKASGAVGVQVGSAFAFSKESGMKRSLKIRIIESLQKGVAKVKTDLLASPTGFPFKLLNLKNTISEDKVYESRKRICDVGYLREAYTKDNGEIGYRCPAEPVDIYIKKGGRKEDTVGRKCLCNGLISTIGLGQKRKDGSSESPIITTGDQLNYILSFLNPGEKLYSAIDVIKSIVGQKLKFN